MAKSKNQSEASEGQSEQLAEAVSCLADEVKVLREAIDELRSAVRWGLQNDKFRSPENPTIEPVEIDHEQIDATVREACSEMSGEVSDAVREGLREENLRRLRDRLGREVAQQNQQSQEPPDPEQELKAYRWPASRITRADMIRLTDLRTLLRRPITKLLHEAVAEFYRLLMVEKEAGPRCCDKPRLRWKSESASNCYVECSSCGFVLCDDGQLADWHDPEHIAWERDLSQMEHGE